MIFIELAGASGATYRYLEWPQTGQAPIAGNFLVLEADASPRRVRLIGVTTDLSRARILAEEAGLAGHPLYVRLNVARVTRRQEHDDLTAMHAGAQVVDQDH